MPSGWVGTWEPPEPVRGGQVRPSSLFPKSCPADHDAHANLELMQLSQVSERSKPAGSLSRFPLVIDSVKRVGEGTGLVSLEGRKS